MKKILSVLILTICFGACKKQDKYTIVPQSAVFYYADSSAEPYALNYNLLLKTTPSFVSFAKPVAYPNSKYESIVTTPFEINSGPAQFFIYDSADKEIENYSFNIPLPDAADEDRFKIITLSGKKYIAELKIKYSKIK